MEQQDYTTSVWMGGKPARPYPALSKDIHADVAIVGGGITGITAAYLLASEGKNVVLLEALGIAKGTTGLSTGNLYVAVGERLHSIDTRHGRDAMNQVLKTRRRAIDFIEQQVQEHGIACAFQRVPWHLFSSQGDKAAEVIAEYRAAKEGELLVSNTVPPDFPFTDVSKVTTLEMQAQINPYTYVQGMAAAASEAGAHLFENTAVLGVDDGAPCTLKTKAGMVYADKVIMATHSPKGVYQAHTEMEVYREFALAVRISSRLPASGIYWHLTDGQQYSVRPYSEEGGDFLVVLGESFRTGTETDTRTCLQGVEDYLHAHFQVEDVVYRWAAQNYKSADGLPYIGTSFTEKNVYIATGFKADGLVWGTAAARILSEAILDREEDGSKLYSPTRFTPLESAEQLLTESSQVAGHLIKSYTDYGEVDALKEIKPGAGKTFELDGDKLAAYRDDANHLHIVSSVCTHMGCIVQWNAAERSWDCPCHGSRFDIRGRVLEGPAYTDLERPGSRSR